MYNFYLVLLGIDSQHSFCGHVSTSLCAFMTSTALGSCLPEKLSPCTIDASAIATSFVHTKLYNIITAIPSASTSNPTAISFRNVPKNLEHQLESTMHHCITHIIIKSLH